jgi:hypothetical protein
MYSIAWWYVWVTMTTIGYGDWIPLTTMSRCIAVVANLLGMLLTALLITGLSQFLAYTHDEQKLLGHLVNGRKHSKQRRIAGNVVGRLMLLYCGKCTVTDFQQAYRTWHMFLRSHVDMLAANTLFHIKSHHHTLNNGVPAAAATAAAASNAPKSQLSAAVDASAPIVPQPLLSLSEQQALQELLRCLRAENALSVIASITSHVQTAPGQDLPSPLVSNAPTPLSTSLRSTERLLSLSDSDSRTHPPVYDTMTASSTQNTSFILQSSSAQDALEASRPAAASAVASSSRERTAPLAEQKPGSGAATLGDSEAADTNNVLLAGNVLCAS